MIDNPNIEIEVGKRFLIRDLLGHNHFYDIEILEVSPDLEFCYYLKNDKGEVTEEWAKTNWLRANIVGILKTNKKKY